MSQRTAARTRQQAHQRMTEIRDALGAIDYLCSGTLLKRMKVCGKPNCRCAVDPAARHGPYFVWGRMRRGKLVQQTLSAEQAETLQLAINNYKKVRKLLRTWEIQTERIVNAQIPGSDASGSPKA